MGALELAELPHVLADIAYTRPPDGPARIRIFPPSSGRRMEAPRRERVRVPVHDCRPVADRLSLDGAGFELRTRATGFRDFYDAERVRAEYYPEVAELLREATGAAAVFVFDHNVRSQARADRKERGVREPVDGAHNDYTLSSGPRRIREVLAENEAGPLAGRRAALVNVWRPIVGPVQDRPLAVCDARTTRLEDFLATEIEHYLEDDLETPHRTGEIFSFLRSPAHRWLYVSDMQPDEVLLLKCFDTAGDDVACFTGHTGFRNPAAPPDARPRESIEARTVVLFP